MPSCKECDGKCCKYVAVEIDGPFTKVDADAIKWYLCHENITVYLDHEDEWMVEFTTRCKFLKEDNMCSYYNKRSNICRDYEHDECEMFGDGDTHKVLFKEPEDVDKYIKEKNIVLKEDED